MTLFLLTLAATAIFALGAALGYHLGHQDGYDLGWRDGFAAPEPTFVPRPTDSTVRIIGAVPVMFDQDAG